MMWMCWNVAKKISSEKADLYSSEELEPNAPNFEDLQEERPSTTLKVGPDGVAAMSSPQAPPARLPPLAGGSNDGDGLAGYRQNLDIEHMTISEVDIQ